MKCRCWSSSYNVSWAWSIGLRGFYVWNLNGGRSVGWRDGSVFCGFGYRRT